MHIFNAKIKICQKDSSSLNQDMHFKIQRHKMCLIVLLNCLNQSTWLNITLSSAKWVRYRACGPQITSSNPHCTAFSSWIIFFENNTFYPKLQIFVIWLIYFLSFYIMLWCTCCLSGIMQVTFWWFEKLFQGAVNHLAIPSCYWCTA